MGNQDCSSMFQRTQFKNLFTFHCVIGRGGFGKVWKVTYKKTNTIYALKQMSKVKIIDKKSEKSVMFEKEILSQFNNPFIVNMKYSFQDYHYLYLLMDFFQGGDIRYHLCKFRTFTEEQTKFFIACITIALHYIHNQKIMHRDLKPENLVLDSMGYVHITDFGVARHYNRNNKGETSGTPGYMAPEVLCGKNHNYLVDYYAMGIIIYEFMLGYRPYLGNTRKEIREQVLARQITVTKSDLPKHWSHDCCDFINRLLVRKWSQRLGKGGIDDIKKHPWYKGFDWDKLNKFELKAPFIPDNIDNYDKHYCNKKEFPGEETVERYNIYRESELYVNAFYNYTCNHLMNEDKKDNNEINNNNNNNGYSDTSTCSTIKTNSFNSTTKNYNFRIRNSLLNKQDTSNTISLKKLRLLNHGCSSSKFLSPHLTFLSDPNKIKENQNDNLESKDNLPLIKTDIIKRNLRKSASLNDLASPINGNVISSSRTPIKYSLFNSKNQMNSTLLQSHKTFLSVHKYNQYANMINSNYKKMFFRNNNNHNNNNSNNSNKNSSSNTRVYFFCSPMHNNIKIKNHDSKILIKHKYRLK
jgi:serum/glucocorticoid-regulated kinase 2